MFDKNKLSAALSAYKKEFYPYIWEEEYNGKKYEGERFKWVAIKTFQDNWDIEADDFPEMLERALSKADNLLTSAAFFPAGMILGFSRNDPEGVRSMFRSLYDEDKDVYERIQSFKSASVKMLQIYGGNAKNHFQDEHVITIYLWLRYPDRYYIYRYGEAKKLSEAIGSDYRIKQGAYEDNIRNYIKLYDEVREVISHDEDMISLFCSHLTNDCYPDTSYHTLTFDFSFYIKNYYSKGKTLYSKYEENWFPSDYSPEISVDRWVELLNDKTVFTLNALEIVKRMKDYGGRATCTQLSLKYGENFNFYNSGSVALARRVADKTGCPVSKKDDGTDRFWSILYTGKYADASDKGVYTWRLRDELSKALEKVDLSYVPLYADKHEDRGYWWLAVSPKIWSIADFGIGEEQNYTFYNENGHKRNVFRNYLAARPGDYIIGYEANPVKQIVALAQVTKIEEGKSLWFKKTEDVAVPIDYADLKHYPELANMEFFAQPNGSFFKLTKDEYDFILKMIKPKLSPTPVPPVQVYEKYTREDFLNEVYMSAERYDMLCELLMNKMNIILQGPPGVGKTFSARKLAYSIMGEKDKSRIKLIQFHQNYSYEDFIMGYKPDGDTFKLKEGIFYQFCRKAREDNGRKYFFIIDEINRGNLSKILGELMMTIEKDYRDVDVTMAYNGDGFSVPKNLYIIGMMNTADRSLAMIDYALRRRFSFFNIGPGFDSEGFEKYQADMENETFDALIEQVKKLNKAISDDTSLGKDFMIGHSYFCGKTKDDCTDAWMRSVVEFDIIPMLEEYWFDEPKNVTDWADRLNGVFHD